MTPEAIRRLADELAEAYAHGRMIAAPPSARDPRFDLATAYAVEAELVRQRRARGRTTVGRKVGFANKAMWRILKLDTLAWAHMYDDTVRYAERDQATWSVAGRCAPKIEPEIVCKLTRPIAPGNADPAAILDAVEWLALGFEVNDCVFPDWTFQPADFVAAFGFHTALVVGTPRPVDASNIAALVEALRAFTVTLSKDGEFVEEGSGKNALRSPALCLGELAGAIERQGADPLAAGELISTGTLTTPQPVAAGQSWRAEVTLLDLPALTLQFN
jgi:2-oxo-3-hexenedioate decarboxylase